MRVNLSLQSRASRQDRGSLNIVMLELHKMHIAIIANPSERGQQAGASPPAARASEDSPSLTTRYTMVQCVMRNQLFRGTACCPTEKLGCRCTTQKCRKAQWRIQSLYFCVGSTYNLVPKIPGLTNRVHLRVLCADFVSTISDFYHFRRHGAATGQRALISHCMYECAVCVMARDQRCHYV